MSRLKRKLNALAACEYGTLMTADDRCELCGRGIRIRRPEVRCGFLESLKVREFFPECFACRAEW